MPSFGFVCVFIFYGFVGMLIAMDCVQILMHEREWTRVGRKESNREHMLMVLANLDHIIIRALYSPNTTESS